MRGSGRCGAHPVRIGSAVPRSLDDTGPRTHGANTRFGQGTHPATQFFKPYGVSLTMADQIRIGIIGLGIMGKQYARVYSEHALTRVVAVCARRQEQADEFAAKYKAKSYTDHRKMLER